MISESSVVIDAPTSLVWDVFSDVERWPERTASVTNLVALDGPGLAIGMRFQIKQPKLPKLVWKVTAAAPGVSWTWAQHSSGGSTVAHHALTSMDDAARSAQPGVTSRWRPKASRYAASSWGASMARFPDLKRRQQLLTPGWPRSTGQPAGRSTLPWRAWDWPSHAVRTPCQKH